MWVRLPLCIFCFAGAAMLHANPVRISAVVQSFPPQIALNWANQNGVTGFVIYRTTTIGGDPNGSGSWGLPIANLSAGVFSFTDTNVSAGVPYEYRIVASGVANSDDYIECGIQLPLVESRGKLLLLVDNSFANDLAFELNRLQRDLAGDGWTVVRHDVSRTNTPSNIKAVIQADYAADPANVTAVLLLGHIPIPYSGWINPDGHGFRPSPTDTYYGDMHGTWTDTVNYGDNSATNFPWWKNLPGDGKFDQSTIPGRMDLQVGRIDFQYLTSFQPYFLYEKTLLQRYLDKDHNFRIGAFNVPVRGADMNSVTVGYCQQQFFGAVNPPEIANYFSEFTNNAYLWLNKGGGGGAYNYSSDIGYTSYFATSAPVKVVFNTWWASSYWEWDTEDAFLRAPLAATGYSLINCWSDNPAWIFHHMALGANVGYSARITQNNVDFYNHQGTLNLPLYRRGVHMSLLGDPTLRLHIVAPPTNLLTSLAGNQVNLSWTASPQTNVIGYNLYRAPSSAGPFTRLNGSLIAGTAFADTNPPAAPRVYQLRAVDLESSGSGTYYNSSAGIYDEQPPQVLFADDLSSTQVKIVWNKPLDPVSSQNPANYSLSGGVLVSNAVLQSDQHTVILTTSPQTDGVQYTLTLNNISDQLNPPNMIAPNSLADYWYSETSEYVADTNTIGLWHLNGNGLDASGNGNTLSLSNGVSFAVASPLGPSRLALHTSGTDANGDVVATAPIPDALVMPSPGRPLTFEARVFVNAWSAYGLTLAGNIATLSQEYDSYFYLLQQGKWDLPKNGNIAANQTTLVNPTQLQSLIPLNQWVQIALVFDGTNKDYVYVNGNLVAGPIVAAPNIGRNNPWQLTLGNFDGYIDEVRLSSVMRVFLAAPSSLTASNVAPSQINLSWINNATNATAIQIQRWNAGLPGAVSIAQLSPTSSTFSDTNVTAGTAYYYRIRATAGAVNSDFCGPATASTPALVASPPTLSLPGFTPGGFSFHIDATPGLPYVIQSSSTLSNWNPIATNLNGGATNFTDPNSTNLPAQNYRTVQ
jgi:hypothetical protein